MSTDKSFVQKTREFFPEVKQEGKKGNLAVLERDKANDDFRFYFCSCRSDLFCCY